MDFAKQQLEKYGWKEGKGLGKNEDGISTALKLKLKFDKSGLGHDIGKQFTDKWWENVYNNALNNVEVKTKDDDVRLSLKVKASNDAAIKSCTVKPDKKCKYNLFVQVPKLAIKEIEHWKNGYASVPAVLNDEELFAACGGRTAHKGARHGLKLSGKLSRIEKQERMLLKKLQNVSICDEKKDIERKMKKIAKHRDRNKGYVSVEDGLSVLNLEDDSRSSSSSSTRKKKKRERRSVSFNETVTEYHTQDLDASTHSSDSNEASILLTVIEKSKIKDEEVNLNNNDDSNVLDEGIEQDIEARNSPDCDHKSFEEAQCSNAEKLSKAERKLKKKIRCTVQFLQEVNNSKSEKEADVYFGCKKCMKRKHMAVEELEDGVYMKRYCNNNQESSKKNKRKRLKEKKWRQKSQEQKINSITRSLDRMCNISDKK